MSVPSLAETIFAHSRQMRPFSVEPMEFQRELVTQNSEIFLQYASSLIEEAIEIFQRVYAGETIDFEELDNVRARLMAAQRILSHLKMHEGLNAAINMIGNIALHQAQLGVFSMTYFHHLALDSFQFIKEYIKPEGSAYGMNLLNEGTVLMLMASLKAERLDEYFRKAVACFEEARNYFPPHSLEYLNALKQEGNSWVHLYELNPQEPSLLREAEKAFQKALGLVNKNSVEQAELLVHLATIPTYEFVLQGNLDVDVIRVSLDRAIAYCLEADKIYAEKFPRGLPRGICLMNLGMTQQLLARLGTDMLVNYQLSLENLYSARAHLQPGTVEYCRCLTNEAMTRTDLAMHEKISLFSNLRMALDLSRESQRLLYEIDRHGVDYALSLYAEAFARFILGTNKHGTRENLQRAVELCERVEEMVGYGTFLFVRSILIEAMARLTLAEMFGKAEDLESVHHMLEQAERLIVPGSIDYAECLLTKAQLLRIAKRPLDEFLRAIELARENYIKSGNDLLVLTVESQSAVAELQAGEFAASRRRCLAALDKQTELLEYNFTMRDKKFLLEQNVLIRSTLVETCLAEGNVEEAVYQLERGRNLLLRQYFQQLVGEIEEMDIDAMLNLAKRIDRAIINITICTGEAVAFIFRPNQSLSIKKLPIRQQDLIDQIFERDLAGKPSGWFTTYFDYLRDKELKRNYLPNWRNQISRTLDWLIAYFVRPLYEVLGEDETRLAFVGGNQLSMLPLHAAIWLYKSADDADPEAELPDIVFAPSMWLLQQSVPAAAREEASENSVAVFRWQGADLRWTELEIEKIQKTLVNASPPPLIFSGEEQNFIEGLDLAASHSIWHFACHGLWQWDDILSSTLLLSHENSLSLDSLFENFTHRFASVRLDKDGAFAEFVEQQRYNDFYNPKLVVFSACEIGIGTEAFTETESCFSFPTAFLLAGAQCIIAALWAVDDFTTSVLMGRFYENLSCGQSYSTSLRDAQIWMKNLRLEELREITSEYNHLPNYPKILKRLNMWQRRKIEYPFAEPYYWAAFQVTGNSNAR
jgi:CHAT domain-containing protein